MNTALFYKVSKGRESIPRKVYKNFIVSRGISLTDSRIEKEMNDLEMVKEIDLAMFQNLVEKVKNYLKKIKIIFKKID